MYIDLESPRFALFNIINDDRLSEDNKYYLIEDVMKKDSLDINGQDTDGNTLLMYAVNMNFAHVDKLISLGARVNIKNNEGYTPLMFAQIKEQIKILVSNGADINAQDNDKASVLDHVGTEKEKIKLLISLGARTEFSSIYDEEAIVKMFGKTEEEIRTEYELKQEKNEERIKCLTEGIPAKNSSLLVPAA